MSAVRESQSEFLVVLKIEGEESYRNVTKVIEPLLVDTHVDRVDTDSLDLGLLEKGDPADAPLDIMNDKDVKTLIDRAPPARRREVRDAVALLRSINESFSEIVEGQSDILKSAQDLNSGIARIRDKVAAATKKSREDLAKLGY
jgi:hypothetical protein